MAVYATRYLEMVKEAETVTTDQGKEFDSRMTQNLMKFIQRYGGKVAPDSKSSNYVSRK